MSPTTNRVLVGMGLVFAAVLALFALGLSGIVLQFAIPKLLEGNVPFLVGSAAIIALAAAAVSIAGTSLIRGIPFHIFGIMGPLTVGVSFEPLRDLAAAGPLTYLAAWCWSFLGESGYRLLRSRRPATSPDSDAPSEAS